MLLGIFTHGHNPAPEEVGYQGANIRNYYDTTFNQVKQITHLLTSSVNYEIKYSQTSVRAPPLGVS